MPGGVSVESAAFPVAVRPCLKLQTRFAPQWGQQPVGIMGQEILTIDLDRLGERTVEQLHVSQWEKLYRLVRLYRDLRR